MWLWNTSCGRCDERRETGSRNLLAARAETSGADTDNGVCTHAGRRISDETAAGTAACAEGLNAGSFMKGGWMMLEGDVFLMVPKECERIGWRSTALTWDRGYRRRSADECCHRRRSLQSFTYISGRERPRSDNGSTLVVVERLWQQSLVQQRGCGLENARAITRTPPQGSKSPEAVFDIVRALLLCSFGIGVANAFVHDVKCVCACLPQYLSSC